MKAPGRQRAVDREVVELLRDEPELLALADAIAATQAAGTTQTNRAWSRRLLRRLTGRAFRGRRTS